MISNTGVVACTTAAPAAPAQHTCSAVCTAAAATAASTDAPPRPLFARAYLGRCLCRHIHEGADRVLGGAGVIKVTYQQADAPCAWQAGAVWAAACFQCMHRYYSGAGSFVLTMGVPRPRAQALQAQGQGVHGGCEWACSHLPGQWQYSRSCGRSGCALKKSTSSCIARM